MKKNAGVLLFGTLFLALGAVATYHVVEDNVSVSNVNAAEGSTWSGLTTDGSVFGNTFRSALQTKINASGSLTVGYTSLWDYLAASDEWSGDSTKIRSFYVDPDLASSDYFIAKTNHGGSAGQWNKEHVWPNSRGVGTSGPGADPQMLRAAAVSLNGSRSNLMYAASGAYDPGSNGYAAARGEAARIIFYEATRYYGGSYNLELTNNTSDDTSNNTMGKLSDLLSWNNTYPVTAAEIKRNNVLNGTYTFARNPFIDHPDWANYIWDANGIRTSAYTPSSSSSSAASSAASSSASSSKTSSSSSTAPVTGDSTTITGSTTNMPTTYPTTATTKSLNGISLSLFNVGTFDNKVSIQFKRSIDAYIANPSSLGKKVAQIIITYKTDPGTSALTVNYGSSSSLGSTATSSSSGLVYAYTLGSGADYFKILNGSSDTINCTSIQIVYASDTTPTVTLSSISASGLAKSSYYVGDAFSTTGLTVTATYSDSSTKTVTGWTTSPANGAALTASNTSCTVSYTEGGVTKTTSINLTITAVAVTSISITTQPSKTSYATGEAFNTTGLVVTASYNNGTSGAVTGYTTSPANGATLSTAGTQTITVTYSGKTTTFTVTVTAPSVTLSSIAVTTQPTKTSYTVGDTLDTTGLVVTASYSNSSTADVTSSCSFSPTTLSTAGTQQITVTYSGQTTTFSVTVTAASGSTGTYSLVTSVGQLSAGRHVLVSNTNTAGSGAYFASTSDTSKGIGRTDNTINSDLTVTPSSTTEEFLLGGSTGAWTLQTTKRSTNGYVTVNSSSVTVSTSSSDNCTLTITMNSGFADIYCANSSTYFGYYNGASYYFDYESSGQTVYLYVETSGSSAGTLTSLSVTTQPTKTTYTVGDTFDTAGMVVTGTYSDGTSSALSSSSYTVNPTNGSTLSTTGTKAVTVSSTDGSLSDTFTITVNAASTPSTTYTGTYHLVTSASELVAGNHYLIANGSTASGSAYFMKNATQGSSYYQGAVSLTLNSDQTVSPGSTTEILTLGGTSAAWTFTTTARTTNGNLSVSYYNSALKSNLPLDSVAGSGDTYYGGWTISLSGSAATIKNTTTQGDRYMIETTYSSAQEYTTSSTAGTLYLFVENAGTWANSFVSSFASICAGTQTNTTPTSALLTAWQSQATSFASLPTASQTAIKGATGNVSGTAVEQAVAKYVYIINKYGTSPFTSYGGDYLAKGSSAYKGESVQPSSENAAILVVAGMMAAGLMGFYLLKKKKAI